MNTQYLHNAEKHFQNTDQIFVIMRDLPERPSALQCGIRDIIGESTRSIRDAMREAGYGLTGRNDYRHFKSELESELAVAVEEMNNTGSGEYDVEFINLVLKVVDSWAHGKLSWIKMQEHLDVEPELEKINAFDGDDEDSIFERKMVAAKTSERIRQITDAMVKVIASSKTIWGAML